MNLGVFQGSLVFRVRVAPTALKIAQIITTVLAVLTLGPGFTLTCTFALENLGVRRRR